MTSDKSTNITWVTNRGTLPYRFLVVGLPNVGKTQLIKRWIQNNQSSDQPSISSETYTPTRQISIDQKLVVLNDGESMLAIEFWEIPTSVASRLEQIYLPNADGAIIVCDATDPSTFAAIQPWQQILLSNQIPAIVCVNKCDSKSSRVAPRMIDESARAFKCVKGFRTSVIECINIDQSLFTLLHHCQRIEKGEEVELHTPTASVTQASSDNLAMTSRLGLTPEISRTQARLSLSHTTVSSRVPKTQRPNEGSINASALMRSRIDRILKR